MSKSHLCKEIGTCTFFFKTTCGVGRNSNARITSHTMPHHTEQRCMVEECTPRVARRVGTEIWCMGWIGTEGYGSVVRLVQRLFHAPSPPIRHMTAILSSIWLEVLKSTEQCCHEVVCFSHLQSALRLLC